VKQCIEIFRGSIACTILGNQYEVHGQLGLISPHALQLQLLDFFRLWGTVNIIALASKHILSLCKYINVGAKIYALLDSAEDIKYMCATIR